MFAIFKANKQLTKPKANKQLALLDAIPIKAAIETRSRDGSGLYDVELKDGYEIRDVNTNSA